MDDQGEQNKSELEQSDSLDQQVDAALTRLGLDDVDWKRLEITPEEMMYLLDRCPYLQVVSTGGGSAGLPKPEFLTARSGWTIHYYGDAMSSSPGKLLFSKGYFPIDEDDDDKGGGTGTIRKQAFDTAAEIVRLAKQFGWTGLHVVDGHPLMQWAAWMAAQDQGLSISGYTPTLEDLKKRERVKRSELEDREKLSARRRPRQ